MGCSVRLGTVALAKVNMDFSYLLTPFLTWFVIGVLKFTINSIRAKKLAFGLIGYGGMPSNHSAIVSSIAALIAFRSQFDKGGPMSPGAGTPTTFTVAAVRAF